MDYDYKNLMWVMTAIGIIATVWATYANFRFGPFAARDIFATLVGNMWIAYYLDISGFYTIIPFYMCGYFLHKLFGSDTPGTQMIDGLFGIKPENISNHIEGNNFQEKFNSDNVDI